MSDHPTDPQRQARLADLHTRLAAGEFAAAFSMDSEPTTERAVGEDRESFRLYAYAAAVDHDPAHDFDGFVEDLWVMVSSDFQLGFDEERPWDPVPRAWPEDPSDPPAVVWGEEPGHQAPGTPRPSSES